MFVFQYLGQFILVCFNKEYGPQFSTQGPPSSFNVITWISLVHYSKAIPDFMLSIKINGVPCSRVLTVVQICSVPRVCPILRTMCPLCILSNGIRSLILLIIHFYLPIFLPQLASSAVLTFKLFACMLQSGGVYLPFRTLELLLFLTASLSILQLILNIVAFPIYPETVSKCSWWYCPPLHLLLT